MEIWIVRKKAAMETQKEKILVAYELQYGTIPPALMTNPCKIRFTMAGSMFHGAQCKEVLGALLKHSASESSDDGDGFDSKYDTEDEVDAT